MQDLLRPLSARSVVLSLLLGAHPDPLPPASFARVAERFGLSGVSIRVALTRAVAAGDVVRTEEGYLPAPSLLERHIELLATEQVGVWDHAWELVSVVTTGRPSAERSQLRTELRHARLAELREGFWLRPANLHRPVPARTELEHFRGRPASDPCVLVNRLWDLEAWQRQGSGLLERVRAEQEPMAQLTVAAALARHLGTDPMLPAELLPATWVGPRLREGYDDYTRALRGVLAVG
ncbi:PaaX family transcriptional regulator C-terminal domain-containing protein [Naumannella halotolerans]|uniref:Phenylacetic acid degradation operon negative regulatory protein n=1 Tax=Naumannella halotolerans TaxID=993414 RepID=A0A4R7J9K8_9ACTN|nr:PaaX family transcriptional regulator C-terminal domain-containing protein [Naumannella halotolerans]TDT33059.1 phenylacetic acid degradation operon negative regulatory protein [Naumannella halotolerans]